MRRYSFLTLGLLCVLPLSAHAQLNKHDQSIANHGYSFPITTYETPMLVQPGSTLRDDIEKGIRPPVAPEAPIIPEYEASGTTLTLPPAMPPAISDLEDDLDQMMEKKTLNSGDVPVLLGKQTNTDPLELLVQKALGEGDKAKDFSLPNALGKTVTLSEKLVDGPVILIWYRGGWCVQCNLQLRAFQKELATIKAAGAQLIAVSPELPDNSMTTVQKNNLEFEVLSDIGSNAARAYGLVYRVSDSFEEKHKDIDLKKHNGSDERELPLTATYVIETDGTIAYAMITPDYRERAEPADVITVLGDINARESIKKSRIRQALEREAAKVDLKNKAAIVEPEARLDINPPLPDDVQETKDKVGKKIDQLEEAESRIEMLEDTTTIKTAIPIDGQVDLKPMVTPPPVGVEPTTTLEVRAKEEGLVPETY